MKYCHGIRYRMDLITREILLKNGDIYEDSDVFAHLYPNRHQRKHVYAMMALAACNNLDGVALIK